MDVLEAECIAAREGIKMALEHTSLPLVIQSDCAKLVNMPNDPDKNQSYLGHVVNEIKEVMKERERASMYTYWAFTE